MNNYQNICQNNEDSSKVQLQFKPDDFYNYEVTGNDGFHYMLVMHQTLHILIFAKLAENIIESQSGRHWIWVDANSQGRYQILDKDHKVEMKLVPAEFVREKYNQAMYFFSAYEDVENKLCASTQERKLQELESERDSHLIRFVNLLINEVANIEHVAEILDNKLNLTISNVASNKDKFIVDLMGQNDNDEWLHLKFNSNRTREI